jgi:transposase-like protein
MKRICPSLNCAAPENIIRDGSFRRKDDSKIIQRYRCRGYGLRFSSASMSDFNRQKRLSAVLLNVNPKTVAEFLLLPIIH